MGNSEEISALDMYESGKKIGTLYCIQGAEMEMQGFVDRISVLGVEMTNYSGPQRFLPRGRGRNAAFKVRPLTDSELERLAIKLSTAHG